MNRIIIFVILCTLPLIAESQMMKLEEVLVHQNSDNQPELTIDLNLHNGKVLTLSDGSNWVIAPQDLNTSQSWILPAPLKVVKSNNKAYPFRIINLTTKASVLARPIARK